MPLICVTVMTCERPSLCLDLLRALEAEKGDHQLRFHVFDDASQADYSEVQEFIDAREDIYLQAKNRYGKRGFFRWVGIAYSKLKDVQADYFVFLPDDMIPCQGFFDEALEAWKSIRDEKKVALNLLVDEGREKMPSWTGIDPERVGNVVHTGWVDGAIFTERRYLEALDFTVPGIPGSWSGTWKVNPRLGSGVGMVISKTLHAQELKMYRTQDSLLKHLDGPGIMNPEARVATPIRTIRFLGDGGRQSTLTREPVMASLASIPSREGNLRRVVETLLPQVDRLNVYLNGYEVVPDFLDDRKIVIARSQDLGDRGDAGKFFWITRRGGLGPPGARGYHFTCDDDILYAPDHVQFMIQAIERYDRRAIVSLHGARLRFPVRSYYRDRVLFHCGAVIENDVVVHVGGTGVMAFHADTIRLREDDFSKPNMADIWMAVAARKQGVPIVVAAHGKERLEILPCEETIYDRNGAPGADEHMTAPLQEWTPWEAPGPEHIKGSATVEIKSGERTYRIRHGKPWDHICKWSRSTGDFYEKPLLSAIQNFGKKGIYLDIGAHIGNHSVFFANECPATKVISVEASEENYELLCENALKNNGGAHIIPLQGIVGASGQKALLERRDPANTGMDAAREDPDGQSVATLDGIVKFLSGGDEIAVIKIDVEGFEPNVIAGADWLLKTQSPLLAIESVDQKTLDLHTKILAPYGYQKICKYGATPVWLWEKRGK